ncbi:hypothetical protein Syun_003249 [Stephania yunnanensis]|uniref:Probable purine permease n=1 Tax=Stephania yunnanensis TaxID=152371 RepID=A0AAP0L2H9_9MAGN
MASSMNIESTLEEGTTNQTKLSTSSHDDEPKKSINWPLLILNLCFIVVGVMGAPLLSRLYYLHGGNRKWVSTLTQSAGFPLILIPLIFFYFTKPHSADRQYFFMEPKLFVLSAIFGVLIGFDNFLYTLGLSYLPVSTSSLLYATQLAFIAVFARIIVKQKFTPYSINSVVLMTLGSIILGLRANGDRPPGVSNKEYLVGFFLTVISAALIGFIFPCIELCYARARTLNYIVVLQFQLNVALFASIFSLVGMAVNKDFQAIKREANEYGLGRHMYVVVLVCGAVAWQLAFIGGLGLIYCVGSLFNGILTSLLLPMTEVAAVIAYHEKFNGEKGMSLALCLWGFTSYFYGEYQNSRKVAKTTQVGSVGA